MDRILIILIKENGPRASSAPAPVGLNSRSRSRKDVVFIGMPVLIILHYGIVCFPFGKFLQHIRVPMFKCARDAQFCIKF